MLILHACPFQSGQVTQLIQLEKMEQKECGRSMIVCSGMKFRWELQRRGLVDSIKCEECVFASDNSLSDTQSEPPWASKYNSEDWSQKIKHLVHPGRAQALALISTLAWIKGVREMQSYNSANTAVCLDDMPRLSVSGAYIEWSAFIRAIFGV